MQINPIAILIVIISIVGSATASMASESIIFEPYTSGGCKPYSKKQLESIKASRNPNLIAGAGAIDFLTNPASTVSKDFLAMGSRIESPKGAATVYLITFQLNQNLPLIPLKEHILELLHDDKENALPYYLNALLKQEKSKEKDALEQIKKGNEKTFNSYLKQRFYSTVKAAQIAKCSGNHARRHAIWNSVSDVITRKSRQLCRNLIKSNGQDARNACFLMGQKLEQGSLTCLGKVFGLVIQFDSFDDIPSNAAARMEIKKKWQSAYACGERRAWDIEETDMTEVADLNFYEIYLEKGEAAAQEFLADSVKQRH
jgi:hypothetical protein